MCNREIRETAKKSGVFLYQVAKAIGKSEPTMTRMLRYELPREEKQKILSIIHDLSETNN